MRILAISGSLRAGSSNALTLRAARELAPDGVDVRIYDGIGALLAFDSDLESAEPLPTEVVALRDARRGRRIARLLQLP